METHWSLAQTPGETGMALAVRLKALRLGKLWTRATLARRAGVSAASLKRLELQGAGSLDLVLRVAFALGRLQDLAQAFLPPEANSVAELQALDERPVRKRGRS